jgi:hypothetical protein
VNVEDIGLLLLSKRGHSGNDTVKALRSQTSAGVAIPFAPARIGIEPPAVVKTVD